MSYGYLAKMLELLTGAYNRRDLQNVQKDRPLETNIGRLFSLFAGGLEAVHKNAEQVRLWDDLQYAEGAVLDRYGANFGVERGAASDALYRILIQVKMMAQLSGGDGDTVIMAAAELLAVEYADILLEDAFPAKIALYVDQTLLSEERLELIEQIAYAIKRILAAGVGMRLYLRTYHTFREELPICHGAAIGTGAVLLPVGADRQARQAVEVAHGAYMEHGLACEAPDAARAVRAGQSGAGGVYCHSHLKTRRID